jgi:PKD repeat protein
LDADDVAAVNQDNDAAASMHVGDLEGSPVDANKNFWWAEVTVTVHNQDGDPVTDATVEGTWSGGTSGGGSCLTGADGRCAVLSPKAPSAQTTILFTVEGVTHATLPYQPADNHDVDGDSDGTTIVVSQASNQPPVAQFSYSCTDLTCAFDASGSSDAEGDIISYAWDFGDGSDRASGISTTHTYSAEGTYTVVLTVIDSDGATDTETQSVTVGASTGTMFIPFIVMSSKVAGPNRSATAVVTVQDTNSNPVAGATVSATWSGDYGESVSGVTGDDGTVSFSSGKVRQADATFTLTVDNVVRDGFAYDEGNSETFATITVP